MRIRDLLLWLGLSAVLLAERVSQGPSTPAWALAGVGIAVLGVAVALGRRRPAAGAGLAGALAVGVAVVHLAFGVAAFPLAYFLALLVLSHRAGRRGADTRGPVIAAAVLAGLGLGGAVVAGLVVGTGQGFAAALLTWVYVLVAAIATVVVPWFVGRFHHQRVALARAGWERAASLERERLAVAERERLRERARIAHDMHDSLGHALSLVALRAGAFEVAPGLSDEQRRAAGELRSATTDAVEHLHDVIAAVRDDPEDTPRSVADVVARAVASGLVVTLREQNGPAVGDDASRVVREALTNAAKHAPGQPVTVDVERDGHTLLRVHNPLGPTSTIPPGSGMGLRGLDERLRARGGWLRAGAEPHGFVVTASIPPTESADLDGPGEPPWDREHRRYRRAVARSVAVPLAAGAALAVVAGVYSLVVAQYSTLPRDVYDGLGPGAAQQSVERTLPPLQVEPPSWAPPPPPGTSCRHHRRDANVVTGPSAVFRLCFADGVLVSKEDLVWEGEDR